MREELDLASHQTGTVILSLTVVALNCIEKSSDSNSKKIFDCRSFNRLSHQMQL